MYYPRGEQYKQNKREDRSEQDTHCQERDNISETYKGDRKQEAGRERREIKIEAGSDDKIETGPESKKETTKTVDGESSGNAPMTLIGGLTHTEKDMDRSSEEYKGEKGKLE